jgi:cell division septum initiation protein DivIVA
MGVEMMEEFSETVDKLHSMYDLERFITEQERLQKRVPELEEEIRRLKPREDQALQLF